MTGPRVLYIDDDEGLRLLTRRALERRGYVVTTAAGGEEGVALATAEPFDLIAIDHYMPGLDGLGTLERLNAAGVKAPVVYVTGSEESRIAVAALKAGAADYVVKTVGDDFFDLLHSAFRSALETGQLRQARDEAEAALQASNERLAVLLREVNHRVANSLQLVSAFVHMQAGALADPAAKAALADTQQRIAAIGQVHRRLYTASDVEAVDLEDYLGALVIELTGAWSTPTACRTLTLSVTPARLETDRAVSLGVIVNELVSNACKYAYPADAAGEVRIRLQRDDQGLVLTVEDDGPGFDPAGPATGTGLGSRIISAMAANLKTRLSYEPGPGTRAVMRIPA
ncbi:response regulator [Caulobacter sp. SLTY]|uniref:response regulator n=1 Tax=Caulobacter sp. SLTY TaxID=2683262 RepID=UPI0014133798|nr:response regulator [Caulobacter sp. SLTY]